MANSSLAESISEERAEAVRGLLASPLLDAELDRDTFRLVLRHAVWLVDYFEETCGWALTVDTAAGFARLAKRPVKIDVSRPLRRTRGGGAAFNRRRYELLCLVCAELVRHPVTTIGLLSTSISMDAHLDTSRYGERVAFVDVLRSLMAWGALENSGGEVEAFVQSERANAILVADTARLHRLLVAATAPSSLPGDLLPSDATVLLANEPRYGEATSDEARNRLARHRLGRRLLDDPVVYVDELDDLERDYLGSISGRRWLRERVSQAGFELEERREGVLAVDPDSIATDVRFPAPMGSAHQLALLLVDRIAPIEVEGGRELRRLRPDELRRALDDLLARFPGWARGNRDEEGASRLLREAIELLAAFGLAVVEPDGSVVGRPAIARYRASEPIVGGTALLGEDT